MAQEARAVGGGGGLTFVQAAWCATPFSDGDSDDWRHEPPAFAVDPFGILPTHTRTVTLGVYPTKTYEESGAWCGTTWAAESGYWIFGGGTMLGTVALLAFALTLCSGGRRRFVTNNGWGALVALSLFVAFVMGFLWWVLVPLLAVFTVAAGLALALQWGGLLTLALVALAWEKGSRLLARRKAALVAAESMDLLREDIDALGRK